MMVVFLLGCRSVWTVPLRENALPPQKDGSGLASDNSDWDRVKSNFEDLQLQSQHVWEQIGSDVGMLAS